MLKRNRYQTFRYNEDYGPLIKAAVSDTKAIIDSLVDQAGEREVLIRGKDMVDVSHSLYPSQGV